MAQRTYLHLSLEERDTIARMFSAGFSLGEISKRLQRNKGTISREIRRNRSPVYEIYGSGRAHQRAAARKQASGHRDRLKNRRLRYLVVRYLKLGWSPEIIAGHLRRRGRRDQYVCPETIYRFLYDPALRRKNNLVPNLVRAHKRRFLRGHRHTHRDLHIPERISIRQRPGVVNSRRQFGHWENDSIQARRSRAGVNVLVERKSRYVKINRIPRRTAHNTREAITRTLSKYPQKARRTITYDNGSENVEHVQINRVLNTRSFFCEPFHSWEKGTVENTIGLVRRTYPKKTNFDRVSAKELKRLERRLNNRPRKILHYRTPREVFRRSVALPR